MYMFYFTGYIIHVSQRYSAIGHISALASLTFVIVVMWLLRQTLLDLPNATTAPTELVLIYMSDFTFLSYAAPRYLNLEDDI